MGRKKVNSVKKTLKLSRPVVEKVEENLFDPFTQSVQPGAFGRLVSMLLQAWLDGNAKVPSPLKVKTDEVGLVDLIKENEDA